MSDQIIRLRAEGTARGYLPERGGWRTPRQVRRAHEHRVPVSVRWLQDGWREAAWQTGIGLPLRSLSWVASVAAEAVAARPPQHGA